MASKFLMYFVLLIVGSGILLISVYMLVFVLIAMLPTIVSATIDKRTTKAASHTIGSFNVIGTAPYVIKLFNSSNPDVLAKQYIFDLNVWLIIYGSTAIGWLVIWLLPQISITIYLLRAEANIANCKNKQNDLIDEWGNKVTELTNAN